MSDTFRKCRCGDWPFAERCNGPIGSTQPELQAIKCENCGREASSISDWNKYHAEPEPLKGDEF